MLAITHRWPALKGQPLKPECSFAGGVMRMALLAQVECWRSVLASLDLELLSADDCAALVEGLARLGKACDAARGRLAARAKAGGAHVRRGFGDPHEWLGVVSGTSAVDARRVLDTAGAVGGCPETERAWRAGQLSVAQATEVVKTEAVRPGSEAELVALAQESPLRVLRETARHRRLTAIDPDELAARQRKARHFRRWHDELGMTRFSGALGPADGAGFLSRLDAETERIRRATRRAGKEEAWEAHAADALVALGQGGLRAGRGGRQTDVVMVCDIGAYRRGHPHDGEPCHVINGGPIPVAEVRQAIDNDAFVKAVIHD